MAGTGRRTTRAPARVSAPLERRHNGRRRRTVRGGRPQRYSRRRAPPRRVREGARAGRRQPAALRPARRRRGRARRPPVRLARDRRRGPRRRVRRHVRRPGLARGMDARAYRPPRRRLAARGDVRRLGVDGARRAGRRGAGPGGRGPLGRAARLDLGVGAVRRGRHRPRRRGDPRQSRAAQLPRAAHTGGREHAVPDARRAGRAGAAPRRPHEEAAREQGDRDRRRQRRQE